MITKDSEITREFVKLLFERVHKRWYVEHALNMIKDENHMKSIILYLKDNKNLSWQDIEYEILKGI